MNERPSSITEDSSSGLDGDQGPPILTVSEISGLLKQTVEEGFSAVRVRGEISGFKRAQSGHLYFTLKDSDAVLDGVCWRGQAGRLGLEIEDGMEVLATGRITTYAARSRYQIIVESMELAGEGALLRLIEERRKRLDQEGLFDPGAKKPLPFLPDVIGVVTSPTGAVIRDILHRLDDRFPRRVLLWPVRVQGEGAAEEIAAVIDGFNRLPPEGKTPRPDVLIVARGGGSLEDLMAFNEEIVVRAVAASEIPVISAIGHETDWTLIDFAADERAPTPTAAAEFAVPVRAVLLAQVMDDAGRLTAAASRLLDDARIRLEGLARGLPNLGRVTDGLVQRLDEWSERLGNALGVAINGRRAELARLAAALPRPGRLIEHAKSQLKSEGRALETAFKTLIRERRYALKQAAELLTSYSYERVLERGFVLVTDTQGLAVDSVSMLNPGMDVRLGFHDGKAGATVHEVKGPRGGWGVRKRRTRKAKPGAGDSRQGKLL
ncbi:MAG: exodeoxyribonuclease VII large subunit [Proteobacteria bacterium]|nr:exodeoxyribonuclease VII large subunit [Pseudomonadota bacterium]